MCLKILIYFTIFFEFCGKIRERVINNKNFFGGVRMKKLLIIMMVLALAAFSFAATTYKDVPVNHWAYDSIERLSSLGIIEGFPDGTYQGLSQVNRYQLTVALDRALKYVEQQLFATLAEKVVSLDKQVQEISKQSQGLSKDEVNSMIKNAMANIDTTALDSKINELEKSVNELKSAYDVISFLSSKLDSLDKRVTQLETTNTYEERISNLEKSINELKSLSVDLSTLKKDVATNKAAIESIGVIANKVADLETKVNAIDLDSVKAEIDSFESKLSSKADIESVNTAIDTKVSEYLKGYAKLSDLESLNIDTLVNRISSVETELNALKSGVSANGSKIDELSANLETLKTTVNANSEELSALELKFDGYVTKDTLKDYVKLSDLKQQYATLDYLNSTLKKYALKTDLSKYAVAADVESKLGNYVTKKEFANEISDLRADVTGSASSVEDLNKKIDSAKALGVLGSILGAVGIIVSIIHYTMYPIK
jgi:peptidoglycan hydrolase CwlO-like protein